MAPEGIFVRHVWTGTVTGAISPRGKRPSSRLRVIAPRMRAPISGSQIPGGMPRQERFTPSRRSPLRPGVIAPRVSAQNIPGGGIPRQKRFAVRQQCSVDPRSRQH